jgi:hypothetical protein
VADLQDNIQMDLLILKWPQGSPVWGQVKEIRTSEPIIILSSRVLTEKLKVAGSIKTCNAIFGTRRFITASTKGPYRELLESRPYSHTHYFFSIHFNIILTSTVRDSALRVKHGGYGKPDVESTCY